MTVRNTRILFAVFFVFTVAAILNALFLQSGPAASPQGRLAAERAQKDAEAERKRRLGLGVGDVAPKPGLTEAASGTAASATASSAVVGPMPATGPAGQKAAAEKSKPTSVPRSIQVPQSNSAAPVEEGAKRLARLKPDSWRSEEQAGAGRGAGDLLPEAPDAEGDASTIAAIQRELNHIGYGPLAADGVPGLATRAAILAYEYDTNAPLAAEASETLLKRLLLGASGDVTTQDARRVKTARAEALIRTVQQSLVTLGYDVGRVDGRLGEETVRAIRAFEADEGLTPKGRVSAEVFARIARAVAVAKVQVVR